MSDQETKLGPNPSQEVAALLRQQTTLARFGELALRSEDLDEILTESCRLVGEALGTDLAKVLELQADGRTLLVRAGVGWKPGVVGHTQTEADEDSSEGRALRTGGPVVSADLLQETRFTTPAFLHENGVRALVNVVIIGGKDRPPYGVLEVDSRSPRQFDEDDISFLRTYANLLAAAVDRLRVLQETRRASAFVQATSEALYSMSPDWSEMRRLNGGGFLADTETAKPNWLEDYIHPDDQGEVAGAISEAIRTKRPFHFEHRVRLVDGTLGWTASRAVPLLDAKDRITEWFGAASDITERVRAKQAADRIRTRLETSLRVARLGTYEWHPLTGRVELDARAREIFGLPAEGQVDQDDMFGRMAPDDVDRVRGEAQAAISDEDGDATEGLGRTFDINYDIVLPDGSRRSISTSGTTVLGDDGERRLLGSINDVTDLKRAEALLREENVALGRRVEDRTQERDRIWQLSQDMLGVADADGVWLSVNPAWTAILGWTAAEIVGRTSHWLQHPDDLVRSQQSRDKLKAGKALYGFENRLRTRDGGYRTIHWTAIPYDGRTYGVGRDVTAERVKSQALAESEAALRQSQKMEAVGQLTGGVAHDFNNLLTVIRSSVDLLKRPGLAEDRRARYVAAISDTVERAAKLTGQLLAFARRQALRPETFAVCDSVRMLSEMLATIAGSRIEIVAGLTEEPCFVNADLSQFDTALVNMAVNARDAMREEGRLTIRVSTVEELPATRSQSAVAGAFVAVSLTDTGSGIPPDQLERIFEPFFTTKEQGRGTGLGLSQVFGFAKQSGGDIAVQSRIGEGSTFTLYLPRVAAPDARPAEVSEPAPLVDGHGTCVLVVEDNTDVGAFATQALAELGYRPILATNAEQALAELDKDADQFDVVFSDVVMPGMSGIELGQRIRQNHQDLPVVLTSGYSHVLAQNGTYGFELLHKPYSIEQLSRVLRKAATRQRRKRILSQ
ncbi:PAS domain S-box protein [Roseomonas nepalensis]|uniref:histidine kinase n=1 Tax=Muricoccus nepalensis TaxID=1854500 RepID=A0A502FIK6_9PROT|nr:PAS domain-containing protein [Roseomonas nepalensis]TPG49288.1 PAS domain S-box protein [Roseomonas nepalensis]